MTHPEAGMSSLRRALLVLTVVITLVAGLGATIEPAAAAAYRTTANLNLRTGPGTSYAVIRTIPSGATVEVTGDAQSGFLPVTYSGSSGFASADYLTSDSSSGSGTTSGPTGTRYVVDGRLNLRSGPSTSYGVILVLQDGSSVQLTGEVSGSYSKVTYNGTTGWVATQYLSTSGGSTDGGSSSDGGMAIGDTVTGTARTTVRLNLRRGPGTGYGTILTMPSGATVDVMGTSQSGFLPIRYNGTKGWSSAQYLTTGGGSTPAPTTPTHPGSGTVVATKVTTANVNFRTGPGTNYGAIRVLAAGTSVSVNGSAQNGFSPVTVSGTQGWISASYLGDPSSTPPPSGNASEQEIINIIYAAADRWGQPRADMLRVARCESGLNPNAVNRSSGASGLFQFMPSTFAFTPNGKRGESIFSAWSSADATGWMWANGMRNHWSCQ